MRATRYLTVVEDGLQQAWVGRILLNPPYAGQAAAFVRRLRDQYDRGNTTAAALIISLLATSSSWFRPLLKNAPICFVGRVAYFTPAGVKTASMNASVVVYLGPDPERFAEVFEQFGPVLRHWTPHVDVAGAGSGASKKGAVK